MLPFEIDFSLAVFIRMINTTAIAIACGNQFQSRASYQYSKCHQNTSNSIHPFQVYLILTKLNSFYIRGFNITPGATTSIEYSTFLAIEEPESIGSLTTAEGIIAIAHYWHSK